MKDWQKEVQRIKRDYIKQETILNPIYEGIIYMEGLFISHLFIEYFKGNITREEVYYQIDEQFIFNGMRYWTREMLFNTFNDLARKFKPEVTHLANNLTNT